MIIYNITIKANLEIARALKDWVKETQFVKVQVSDTIIDAKIYKLMGIDDSDGLTYCVQYHFTDMNNYNLFKIKEDVAFKKEILAKFNDKMVLFTSILSEE